MPTYPYYDIIVQKDGTKVVRKVRIKGEKGHKSVSHYKRGKHIFTSKKVLKPVELALVKIGKVIPGLFKDCGCNKTKKRRKQNL